jgi:lipoyl(octanoyl) transferase
MLKILDFPILGYKKAWEIQKILHWYRVNDIIPDTLLLLEHFPVITLGKFGKEENLLLTKERLKILNIEFFRTDRGGDITYHGPGQLIGYFIFKIDSIRKLIFSIEMSIVELLKNYKINSEIIDKYPGVWVGDKKICAIGMTVKKKVSYHGFALNVNNDLTPFSYIIPCGLKNKGVTSIYNEIKIPLSIKRIKGDFINIFTQVYGVLDFHIIELYDDKIEEVSERLLEVLKSP